MNVLAPLLDLRQGRIAVAELIARDCTFLFSAITQDMVGGGADWVAPFYNQYFPIN